MLKAFLESLFGKPIFKSSSEPTTALTSLPCEILASVTFYLDQYGIGRLWMTGSGPLRLKMANGGVLKLVCDWNYVPRNFCVPSFVSSLTQLHHLEIRPPNASLGSFSLLPTAIPPGFLRLASRASTQIGTDLHPTGCPVLRSLNLADFISLTAVHDLRFPETLTSLELGVLPPMQNLPNALQKLKIKHARCFRGTVLGFADHLPQLIELNIQGSSGALEGLEKLTMLETLVFKETSAETSRACTFAPQSIPSSLTTLRIMLHSTSVYPDWLAIERLPRNLRHLTLLVPAKLSAEQLLNLPTSLHELVLLNYAGSWIKEQQVSLEALQSFPPSLKVLRVSLNHAPSTVGFPSSLTSLTEASRYPRALCSMPVSLTSLRLAECQISETQLSVLPPMLTHLHVAIHDKIASTTDGFDISWPESLVWMFLDTPKSMVFEKLPPKLETFYWRRRLLHSGTGHGEKAMKPFRNTQLRVLSISSLNDDIRDEHLEKCHFWTNTRLERLELISTAHKSMYQGLTGDCFPYLPRGLQELRITLQWSVRPENWKHLPNAQLRQIAFYNSSSALSLDAPKANSLQDILPPSVRTLVTSPNGRVSRSIAELLEQSTTVFWSKTDTNDSSVLEIESQGQDHGF